MKKKGQLTLIPTPISETGVLESVAFNILLKASTEKKSESIFVIEDLKPGRKRWLQFNLPREIVTEFILYNEHTAIETSKMLLKSLQEGFDVYLMSDGGLPAFYDPGVELVALCHENQIKVTSTPFCNSVVLALALSGFNHKQFWFEGFLPLDSEFRYETLKKLLMDKNNSIVMDTPYRMKRVLEEIIEVQKIHKLKSRKLFLAMDLNTEQELLLKGNAEFLLSKISDFKREFILIIGT